ISCCINSYHSSLFLAGWSKAVSKMGSDCVIDLYSSNLALCSNVICVALSNPYFSGVSALRAIDFDVMLSSSLRATLTPLTPQQRPRAKMRVKELYHRQYSSM